ncbi:MAG: DUF362 domain-containing protein [Candidatus Aminicenantales bacterium]
MKRKIITRRDFLKAAALTPLASAVGCCCVNSKQTVENSVSEFSAGKATITSLARKSRVILIRDKNVVTADGKIDPDIIQKMLDEAVTTLLGEKDPVAAWKNIIHPTDTVGIKTNVWRYLPTGPEIEQALKRRIMDAGVPEERIGIDDRGVLRNPIFKEATALINARPGRTHHWSGMGTCIKNYIMFVPSPPAYHNDACADLATIWYLPQIKGKTRLNVLVMLTPLFHGIGPHHFSKKYIWPYKGLIVGQDPVAVDATGVQILQARRNQYFGENRPLQPPAHHIFLADTRHRLGISNPGQIELIKLGWQDDILI